MKVDDVPDGIHNPLDETDRVSCLRENFTSSSYGEGLETDRDNSGTAPVPYPTKAGLSVVSMGGY